MIKYIFLDMDGVLVDLIPAMLKHHGKKVTSWPKGEYDIAKVVDIFDFWSAIEDVYMDAKLSRYGYKLLDFCKSHASTTILSDPFSIPDTKRRWLRYYLPTFDADKAIFLSADKKARLACPDALLIDDSEQNCADWRDAGGVAYCWPQPWNYGIVDVEESFRFLTNLLEI